MRTKKKQVRIRDSRIAQFIMPNSKDKRMKPKLKIQAQLITGRMQAEKLSKVLDKFLTLRS